MGGPYRPLQDGGPDEPSGPLHWSDAPVTYGVSAVLLASAFVALLWVPSYAHLTPTLGGIPFFYWYSMLWLVVNAACQAVAYQLLVAGPRRRAQVRGAASTPPSPTGGRP